MKMWRNMHSGGSAVPWKGTDCGTLGGLRQFCAEFVDPESCLGRLGLGGGNEALFFLPDILGLTSATAIFLSLIALAFASFAAFRSAWS